MGKPSHYGTSECQDRLHDAIALFELARDDGRDPKPEDWYRRFPDMAKGLADYFAAQELVSPPERTQCALDRRPQFIGKGPVIGAAAEPLNLTVTEGPLRGMKFTFPGPGSFLVGRSSRAQFQFPSGTDADLRISHTHFLVEVNVPLCRLHDLNSHNGTFVNGRRVTSTDLRQGDLIKVGHSVLRVDWQEKEPEESTKAWCDFIDLAPVPPAAPSSLMRRKTCPICRMAVGRSPDLLCPACRKQADGLAQPLPGYRLIRELGRGGMGVVYLALRPADGRVVAVKTIMPAAVITHDQVARFLREAEILKKLVHAHIVRFDEMGLANGLLFLAMEYVSGTDVHRLVRAQGPLRVRPAARLTCQLLTALEYAHARRYVHRDIKPANLLLQVSSHKKAVKLADFGLARVYQESQLSGLTLQGDVGGTPAYLAPEQIHDYRSTQPAADQYSAAATLYFLLTGKNIYDLPRRIPDQLAMILRDDPIPILQRRPELPEQLGAVIHRALSRDPETRFRSVRAFRKALLPFAT